jgi:chromosome segregation ATPase
MEDLEQAAQKAVDELKELDARLDQTEQRLAGLRQQVDQAGDRLDDDWQALAQQFDSFFQVVEAEKARLLEEAEEARRAVGALEGTVEEAGPAAARVIEEGRDGVGSFSDEIEASGPSLAQMVEETRTAYDGLSQRTAAVQQQLAQVLGEARDFLQGELLTGLQEMQTDVRQRSEEVRTAVTSCEGDLDAAFGEWKGGMDELRVTVDGAFEDVGQHVGLMVEEALSEVAQAQGDALEELSGYAETLAEILTRLGEAATQGGTDIAEGVGTLEQEAAETTTGLETMQARLSEVRELLARFTFVSL